MIRLPECPICQKPVPPASDPNSAYSPFCSRRCQEVDLIRWCDGRYAILEKLDPARMAEQGLSLPDFADAEYETDFEDASPPESE